MSGRKKRLHQPSDFSRTYRVRFREGLVNAMVELRNDRSVLHGRITDLRFTIVTGRVP